MDVAVQTAGNLVFYIWWWPSLGTWKEMQKILLWPVQHLFWIYREVTFFSKTSNNKKNIAWLVFQSVQFVYLVLFCLKTAQLNWWDPPPPPPSFLVICSTDNFSSKKNFLCSCPTDRLSWCFCGVLWSMRQMGLYKESNSWTLNSRSFFLYKAVLIQTHSLLIGNYNLKLVWIWLLTPLFS